MLYRVHQKKAPASSECLKSSSQYVTAETLTAKQTRLRPVASVILYGAVLRYEENCGY